MFTSRNIYAGLLALILITISATAVASSVSYPGSTCIPTEASSSSNIIYSGNAAITPYPTTQVFFVTCPVTRHSTKPNATVTLYYSKVRSGAAFNCTFYEVDENGTYTNRISFVETNVVYNSSHTFPLTGLGKYSSLAFNCTYTNGNAINGYKLTEF